MFGSPVSAYSKRHAGPSIPGPSSLPTGNGQVASYNLVGGLPVFAGWITPGDVVSAGKAGGQTIIGGTASGDNLTLKSNPTNDGTVAIDGVEIGTHATGGKYLKSTRNAAGSDDWLIYCNGGTVFVRNAADTAYHGLAASQVSIGSKIGLRDHPTRGVELASDRPITFSSGATYFGAKDTGLARDEVGVVRVTDGSTGAAALHLTTIRTPSTSAATTLGSVIGKYPIYDAGGTLVGYLPIYDSIT